MIHLKKSQAKFLVIMALIFSNAKLFGMETKGKAAQKFNTVVLRGIINLTDKSMSIIAGSPLANKLPFDEVKPHETKLVNLTLVGDRKKEGRYIPGIIHSFPHLGNPTNDIFYPSGLYSEILLVIAPQTWYGTTDEVLRELDAKKFIDLALTKGKVFEKLGETLPAELTDIIHKMSSQALTELVKEELEKNK